MSPVVVSQLKLGTLPTNLKPGVRTIRSCITHLVSDLKHGRRQVSFIIVEVFVSHGSKSLLLLHLLRIWHRFLSEPETRECRNDERAGLYRQPPHGRAVSQQNGIPGSADENY